MPNKPRTFRQVRIVSADSKVEVTLKFDETQEEEYDRFLSQIKQTCFIIRPTIDKLYQYVKFIGKGSQAKIELYKTHSA
jgi:hypothetical protein